jgi:hypothetical protein
MIRTCNESDTEALKTNWEKKLLAKPLGLKNKKRKY